MTKLVLSFLLIFSAFAGEEKMTAEKCAKMVESNIDTFSVCYSDHNSECAKDKFCYAKASKCKLKKKGWVCTLNHSYPSSECIQKIFMDKECFFNRGAKIIKDHREDF